MTLKESLGRKSKEAKASISELKKVLPQLEVPEIIRKNHKKVSQNSTQNRVQKQRSDIEDQLMEIQHRLDMLQSQNR